MRLVVEFGDDSARGLFEHERQDRMNQRGAGRSEQKACECQGENKMLTKGFIDRSRVGGEEVQNFGHVIFLCFALMEIWGQTQRMFSQSYIYFC